MTITFAIRIPGEWSQNALFVTGSILGVEFLCEKFFQYNGHHFGQSILAVFETARGAKFDPEYLGTGSTCADDFSPFKTTLHILVKFVTTSWPTCTHWPIEGANLAKKPELYRICCT